MKLYVLHIGDMHISENCQLEENITQIASIVKSKTTDISNVLILITGDIANRGSKDEYNISENIIDKLISRITNNSKLRVDLFMVPGNHDCDLSEDQTVREILIESVISSNGKVNDSIIENICCVQKNYFNFQNKFHSKNKALYESKLFSQYSLTIGGEEVKINCFNMAWLSTIKEKQGALFFPIEKYEKTISEPSSGLVLSLFHHPYIWQSATRYRGFLDVLERNSSIVLTGHEHIGGGYTKHDLQGRPVKYMEGGVLNDSSCANESSFNTATINIKNKEVIIETYRYNGSIYKLENSGTPTLLNLISSKLNCLSINRDTKSYIEDAGATFTHPIVENLLLDDVFVFPDLKNLKLRKAKTTYDEVTSSYVVIDGSPKNEKVIIVGAERSGKTTLCKKAFASYYAAGYIPVLIKGTEIGSGSLNDFEKLIIKKFIDQYVEVDKDIYSNLELEKFFIIIDDFDRSRINLKTKGKLLCSINDRYSRILLTANEFFQIEELSYEEDRDRLILENFNQYKLLHFGHQLRLRIIEKWFRIGREHEIEEPDLVKQCDKGKLLIDSVIGKNLVPSYPIFLLTLLQSIEAGTPHDLKSGSHGYYYNYLISQAFGRAKLKSDEFESYYNFASIIAYQMYRQNVRCISDEELAEIYEDIKRKYVVVDNYDKFKKTLIDAKILDIEYGNIEIKYKYIYYFFVAKYISDHLSEDYVCNQFKHMCGRLHIEQCANIVLFLSHHTKHEIIVDTILSSSRKLFGEFPPIDLKIDVSVINELVKEVPKYVLQKKSITEYRDEKLRLKDKTAPVDRDVKVDEIDGEVDENTELDLVQKLNAAFKTMEILGQIIKTYYGTLPKDTSVDVAQEAYCITLRTLKSFFQFLENNLDLVVSDINKRIDLEGISEKDDIEEYSKRMVFFLASVITTGFIKKLSGAIGSDKLGEIYNLTHERIGTISSQLINSSICLDFSYKFPSKEIREINKSKNPLVFDVVRRMAIDYLYMFNTDIREKQQICEMLKISIDNQRIIDGTSTQRKR